MGNTDIFSKWLTVQMKRENWTQADLARATGIGRAAISKMISNKKSLKPKPESCLALAKAFRLAPETVYRAAGILPTEPEFPELDDLKAIASNLSARGREEIVAIARAILDLEEKTKATPVQ